MITDFDSLVRFLDREVPWSDSQDDAVMWRVGDAIGEAVRRDPGVIKDRLRQIMTTPELFSELLPLMEFPHNKRDKYVLYKDPGERYTVRLHRFHPCVSPGSQFGPVHNHKYSACTVLLRGAYDERVYRELSRDENSQTAKLELTLDHVLRKDAVDVKGWRMAHQVRNSSDDEAVFTLFVRGPSFTRFGDIFNLEDDTFMAYAGAGDMAKVGLLTAMLDSSALHTRHEVMQFIGRPADWPQRIEQMVQAAAGRT